MAREAMTVRLDAEDVKSYQDMAAALREGLRQLGAPEVEVTPTGLLRDVATGGARRYRALLDRHASPLELVQALGQMSLEEVEA